MKYQLVIQWPAAAISDLDRIVAIERRIIEALPDEDGEVDGHDIGSWEMNIFVRTGAPERAFAKIRQILAEEDVLKGARVAYRALSGSAYNILWPIGLKVFRVS
jgi:hypothetical protein